MTGPCVSPATLIAEGLRQGCIEWRNSNATLVGLEWRSSNATLVGLEWRNSNATLVGLEWRSSNATLDSVRAIIGLAFLYSIAGLWKHVAALDFSLHPGRTSGRCVLILKHMRKLAQIQLYDFQIRHLYTFSYCFFENRRVGHFSKTN